MENLIELVKGFSFVSGWSFVAWLFLIIFVLINEDENGHKSWSKYVTITWVVVLLSLILFFASSALFLAAFELVS